MACCAPLVIIVNMDTVRSVVGVDSLLRLTDSFAILSYHSQRWQSDNWKPDPSVALPARAGAISGRLSKMCSVAEAQKRQECRDVAYFEVVEGTENDRRPSINYDLAVATFKRPTPDLVLTEDDLRPLPVLERWECIS